MKKNNWRKVLGVSFLNLSLLWSTGPFIFLSQSSYAQPVSQQSIFADILPALGSGFAAVEEIQQMRRPNTQAMTCPLINGPGGAPVLTRSVNLNGSAASSVSPLKSHEYFPRCGKLPAGLPTPEQICNMAKPRSIGPDFMPDMNSLQQISMEASAQASCAGNVASFYEQAANPAADSGTSSFGVSCIQREGELLLSELKSYIDELTLLSKFANEQVDAEVNFQNGKDGNLYALRNLQNLLDGKAVNDAQKAALQKQADLMAKHPLCKNAIDPNEYTPTSKGLINFQDSLTNNVTAAVRFNASAEKDFKNQVQQTMAKIKNAGALNVLQVDGFLQSMLKSTSKGKSAVEGAISEFQFVFQNKVKEYNKKLSDAGVAPINIDDSSELDIDRVLGQADQIRGNFIKKCMRDNLGGAGGNNFDAFIGSIQKSDGSNSNTDSRLNSYKNNLANIFSTYQDPKTLVQKLKELKQQNSKGNGQPEHVVEINNLFRDTNGKQYAQGTRMDPVELAILMQQNCEVIVEQGRTLDAKGSSEGQKARTAENALKSLQKDIKNFSADMTQFITDNVLECKGTANISRTFSNDSCFSGDYLNPDSGSFCLKFATQCRQNVEGCNSFIKQTIEGVRANKQTQANLYNNRIYNPNNPDAPNTLVGKMRGRINQTLGAIGTINQSLMGIFGGNSKIAFDLPDAKALTISPPVLGQSQSGITDTDLYGGGNLSWMDQYINNIDTLKKSFEDQIKKVEQEIYKNINQTASSAEKIANDWKSLQQDCASVASDFRDSEDELVGYINAQAQQQEMAAEMACAKLSQQTIEICNDSKLSELGGDIAAATGAFNTRYANALLSETERICLTLDEETEAKDSDGLNFIEQQCAGSTSDAVFNKLAREVADNAEEYARAINQSGGNITPDQVSSILGVTPTGSAVESEEDNTDIIGRTSSTSGNSNKSGPDFGSGFAGDYLKELKKVKDEVAKKFCDPPKSVGDCLEGKLETAERTDSNVNGNPTVSSVLEEEFKKECEKQAENSPATRMNALRFAARRSTANAKITMIGEQAGLDCAYTNRMGRFGFPGSRGGDTPFLNFMDRVIAQ